MTKPPAQTILIVDDDEVKRYTIARYLQKNGFSTLEANTGQQGLEQARKEPDLIILDIRLPDIDGFEVCRILRADPVTAAIPVLHISAAFISTSDRVHGLEAGADAYLTSSVELTEWMATIQALLRARKAEKAVRQYARQWQSTFDAIRDAICLLDLQGTVLRTNQSFRAWTRSAGDPLHNRTVYECVPSELRDGLQTLVEQVRASRQRHSADVAFRDQWFCVTADLIENGSEPPSGIVCTFVDITLRKKAERQLKDLNETLEQKVKERTQSLNRHRGQLRNLVFELTLTEQRERNRMAGEVHDSLAQILAVSKMKMELLHRLRNRPADVAVLTEDVTGLLGRCLDYTRGLITELSPRILYESGLLASLHWLANQMKNHKLNVVIQDEGVAADIGLETGILVYQTVRELLFNVVKYAQVDEAVLTIRTTPGNELSLTVADRGVGFDTALDMCDFIASGHLGLFSVQERIEAMGGSLDIVSGINQGTSVTLTVPIPEASNLARNGAGPREGA